MKQTEAAIHKAILAYLRLRFPRALVVHAANEMNLAADPKSKAIAQNRAKSLGMVPGWPDLQLLLPDGNALFFECKAPGGRVSEAQQGVLDALTRLGFRAAVVRSVRDVEDCLNQWDVDGAIAWQSIGNVTAKLQKTLAKQREAETNESGGTGASNTLPRLTEANLGKRSDHGC